MGVSQNKGYHLGDPHNKDYNILGSTLGSPYFGKLPYGVCLSYGPPILGNCRIKPGSLVLNAHGMRLQGVSLGWW